MNRADVELLQNSLVNLGNSAQTRRQEQFAHDSEMKREALESQLRDIQQSRYDAQSAHFSNMEDTAAAKNVILAQSEADKTKIAEEGKIAAQKFSQGQDGMKQLTQTLRANRLANQQDPSKGMTQEEATDAFQTALKGVDPAIHDQMMQNPQYSALYSGKIDFGTIPQLDAKGNPVGGAPQKQSALVEATAQVDAYRQKAAQTDDPDEQAKYNHLADLVEDGVKKLGAGYVKPPPAPIQIQKQYDAGGHMTNQVTAPLTAPASWPAAPPSMPAPAPNPSAGGDPSNPFAPPLVNQGSFGPSQAPVNVSAPAGAAPPAQGPVQVNTQADYDALPPGAKYIDSKGQIGTKKTAPVVAPVSAAPNPFAPSP